MSRPSVVPFPVTRPKPQVKEPLLRDVVGQILRDRRKEQGRTLEDVAKAARVSTPYLSEVERGRKEPSSEVLAAICGSLGLSLADLIGEVHLDLSATTVPAQAHGHGATNPGGNVVSLMVA